MTCPHITTSTREYNVCALNLYGGKPSHGTCKLCIQRGQNNEVYAKELFARAERTHPSTVPRVSGCCDSARNYFE